MCIRDSPKWDPLGDVSAPETEYRVKQGWGVSADEAEAILGAWDRFQKDPPLAARVKYPADLKEGAKRWRQWNEHFLSSDLLRNALFKGEETSIEKAFPHVSRRRILAGLAGMPATGLDDMDLTKAETTNLFEETADGLAQAITFFFGSEEGSKDLLNEMYDKAGQYQDDLAKIYDFGSQTVGPQYIEIPEEILAFEKNHPASRAVLQSLRTDDPGSFMFHTFGFRWDHRKGKYIDAQSGTTLGPNEAVAIGLSRMPHEMAAIIMSVDTLADGFAMMVKAPFTGTSPRDAMNALDKGIRGFSLGMTDWIVRGATDPRYSAEHGMIGYLLAMTTLGQAAGLLARATGIPYLLSKAIRKGVPLEIKAGEVAATRPALNKVKRTDLEEMLADRGVPAFKEVTTKKKGKVTTRRVKLSRKEIIDKLLEGDVTRPVILTEAIEATMKDVGAKLERIDNALVELTEKAVALEEGVAVAKPTTRTPLETKQHLNRQLNTLDRNRRALEGYRDMIKVHLEATKKNIPNPFLNPLRREIAAFIEYLPEFIAKAPPMSVPILGWYHIGSVAMSFLKRINRFERMRWYLLNPSERLPIVYASAQNVLRWTNRNSELLAHDLAAKVPKEYQPVLRQVFHGEHSSVAITAADLIQDAGRGTVAAERVAGARAYLRGLEKEATAAEQAVVSADSLFSPGGTIRHIPGLVWDPNAILVGERGAWVVHPKIKGAIPKETLLQIKGMQGIANKYGRDLSRFSWDLQMRAKEFTFKNPLKVGADKVQVGLFETQSKLLQFWWPQMYTWHGKTGNWLQRLMAPKDIATKMEAAHRIINESRTKPTPTAANRLASSELRKQGLSIESREAYAGLRRDFILEAVGGSVELEFTIRQHQLYQMMARDPSMSWSGKGKPPPGVRWSKKPLPMWRMGESSLPIWGELAGRHIHADIYHELLYAQKLSEGITRSGFAQFIRFWKGGHTFLNPATTFRNIYTNVLLFAPMAGMNPLNPFNWKFFARALKEFTIGTKSKMWMEAYRNGAFDGNFVRSEVLVGRNGSAHQAASEFLGGFLGSGAKRLRKFESINEAFFELQSLGELRLSPRFQKLLKTNPENAWQVFNMVAEKGGKATVRGRVWRGLSEQSRKLLWENPGVIYGAIDDYFRFSHYLKLRSKGMSATEASRVVRKAYVDYNDVNGLIQRLRAPTGKGWTGAWILAGSPFATFMWKGSKLVMEWLERSPVLAQTYINLYDKINGLQMARELGMDEEAARKWIRATRKSLPAWAQGTHEVRTGGIAEGLLEKVLGPKVIRAPLIRDEEGNVIGGGEIVDARTINLDNIDPLSWIAIQKAGDDNFGIFDTFVDQALRGKQPILSIANGWLNNESGFLRKEITPPKFEGETPAQYDMRWIKDKLIYTSGEVMPPLVPGGYGYEKFLRIGNTDLSGHLYTTAESIFDMVFGIRGGVGLHIPGLLDEPLGRFNRQSSRSMLQRQAVKHLSDMGYVKKGVPWISEDPEDPSVGVKDNNPQLWRKYQYFMVVLATKQLSLLRDAVEGLPPMQGHVMLTRRKRLSDGSWDEARPRSIKFEDITGAAPGALIETDEGWVEQKKMTLAEWMRYLQDIDTINDPATGIDAMIAAGYLKPDDVATEGWKMVLGAIDARGLHQQVLANPGDYARISNIYHMLWGKPEQPGVTGSKIGGLMDGLRSVTLGTRKKPGHQVLRKAQKAKKWHEEPERGIAPPSLRRSKYDIGE